LRSIPLQNGSLTRQFEQDLRVVDQQQLLQG